ncbi:hypothetical protein K0I73_04030 [Shewanella mesophila]|uniref:hypothetical protein n=1 Tax=Shewanella mesophila TaxID=2864208 RepID=UPI001C659BF4|nr:hypothetical protein [Shewanella mesophila]QYJ86915.1 hypothetical protein K0I73_04030 [Shewanella mesophila]
MKTLIGISTFSFASPNFRSFEELENQFKSLPNLRKLCAYTKVSFEVANDILHNKDFGLSINEQVSNFEYGTDIGAITRFRLLLDRTYLRGMNRSFSHDELLERADKEPNTDERENTIVYSPSSSVNVKYLFTNETVFYQHYEFILGHFPIDNKSYYERATSFFNNLEFHKDCFSTLGRVTDGFCNYSIAFTKCLSALNECSPISIRSTKDKLTHIATKATFDCTVEGSPHKNFRFDFAIDGKEYDSLDCQFHLKPSKKNKQGNNSFHHKRLYFGFIPISETQWKIAVAAIGPHINKDSNDRYAPLKDKRKKK